MDTVALDSLIFFAWKTLIDYTNLFSPYFFLMTMHSWVILKMNQVNSFEGIDASKFRLSKIIKTEDCFKREKEKKGEKNNE